MPFHDPPERDLIAQPAPGGDRLDFVSTGWRPWALLLLLCLTLYVPGITAMPPVDRDEARYIQATRQMLESQDFLRIRFQDTARNKKPAAIYWMQAASVLLFSDAASTAVWPYRLVSLAGALAAVMALFAMGQRLFDKRTALVAAALLACSLDLVFEAHVATTDAMMLATVIVAQGLLAQAYLSFRRGESFGIGAAAVFWIAESVSILIKGPVLPALSALTVLALVIADRRGTWLKTLRWPLGVALLVVIVLPWLIMIQHATDGSFLRDSVGKDLLGKVKSPQEAHGAPAGYYLLASQMTAWPMTLFEGLAVIWAWRHRRLSATRVLIAWLIPFWIVLECVPTKLPHYVLPIYPAFALLTARAIIAYTEEGFHPRSRGWIVVPAIMWSVAGVLISGALLFLAQRFDWNFSSAAGVIVVVAGILAGLWQFWRLQRAQHHAGSIQLAVACSCLLVVPIFAMILPSLAPFWVSREASEMVAGARQPAEPVAAVGYAEPSLVFLLGTNTQLLEPEAAAAALASNKVRLVLVEKSKMQAFDAATTERHLVMQPLGAVSGLNYSNGHAVKLTLYRRESPP